MGRAELASYAVTDGGILYDPGGGTGIVHSASCSETELVEDGYSVEDRSSSALLQELLALEADGGAWAAAPYAR
ncbi:MAG: hypothetical protein ACYCWW_08055 [Deltaproteobacteria bacterium]